MTVSVVFTKNPTKEDKSAALGGLIIGVPVTAAATFMLLSANKSTPKSLKPSTEQIFLELVAANGGRITPIKLAIAANLPLADAKQYLDQKAIELNANFEVTDEGGINYHFHI